jgi:hypothetical protein
MIVVHIDIVELTMPKSFVRLSASRAMPFWDDPNGDKNFDGF